MTKYKSVDFAQTDVKSGFWHMLQTQNAKTTIYAIRRRFEETGRFKAFNFGWKEGMPNKPHIFWDSDIAKWIEAASIILEKNSDPELEAAIDSVVDCMEAHQEENGYFNIYFTVAEPENRWKKRTEHELFCAGTIMEAAVAYYHATKKTRLLKMACRLADHIEQVFVKEKSAAFTTPGHSEIELALVRLYHATNDERYLQLSRFFIDNRALQKEEFYPWADARYSQDQSPVREQTTAEGHAVRAMFLYCGMADLALELSDAGLYKACRRIFEDVALRKMYITGGVGSSFAGEAFTLPYDLPNLTAYAETCAAVGLVFFAQRMLRLEADSMYADVAERVLYNGFLSGISLDGKSFFYENPLEIDPALIHKDVAVVENKMRFPITQRMEVFECSCCPPNVSRLIGSVANMLYTYNDTTLFVHHYMSSETDLELGGRRVHIEQSTDYPYDGRVKLQVSGAGGVALAVRIPEWCGAYEVSSRNTRGVTKGYLYIPCESDMFSVELKLEMTPTVIEATPEMRENAGRAAITYGPMVYCMEAVDNGENLRDLVITGDFSVAFDERLRANVITASGYRRDAKAFLKPYRKAQSGGELRQQVKLIPYHCFANRGESAMLVWAQYRETRL